MSVFRDLENHHLGKKLYRKRGISTIFDSTSRRDISILRAHKAPFEGDAQMTNRSANNKSEAAFDGIPRVDNGKAEVEGRVYA